VANGDDSATDRAVISIAEVQGDGFGDSRDDLGRRLADQLVQAPLQVDQMHAAASH